MKNLPYTKYLCDVCGDPATSIEYDFWELPIAPN
jgi:hypothetical protein